MTWKVIEKDDSNILAFGSFDSREEFMPNNIYIKGALAYNNAVYVLNDLCEQLFSNKSIGIFARNLNKSDVLRNLTEEGKKNQATWEEENKQFLDLYVRQSKPIYFPVFSEYELYEYGTTESENSIDPSDPRN